MRMMKVLDLDMDFFLTDACPLAPLGERPPETCAEPYSDEQVSGDAVRAEPLASRAGDDL